MVKAVFIDRDGTINKLIHGREQEKHVCPWLYSEFEYIAGVHEAVAKFKSLGYTTHLVTNQPDVDDGYTTEETMNAIHDTIKKDLKLDTINVARTRNTLEYKPNSGMIDSIVKKWVVTRERSWMIGDTWRDVVAGHRAGLITIYIGVTYKAPKEYPNIFPDYCAADLLEASKIIEQNEAGR